MRLLIEHALSFLPLKVSSGVSVIKVEIINWPAASFFEGWISLE